MTATTVDNATEPTLDALSRERLSEWWRRADRPPSYPAFDQDVVELVRSVEYEVTVETIDEFIDNGYIEREISRSAYEYQLRIESGEQVVVGLNQYQSEGTQKLELFQFDPEEEEWQKGRLAETKGGRSPTVVKSALSSLKQAARDDKNLMPLVLEAVGALATEGEILDTMRDVYGEYVDPGVF